MDNTFDLVIIGGGPGGYETALMASRRGLSVAVVEQLHLGGTCLNEGCIPTKCLCHDAQLMDEIKMTAYLDIPSIKCDWLKVQKRKNQIKENLRQGISSLMSSAHVSVFCGKADFIDYHIISVWQKEGMSKLFANNIIVATGSVPKELQFIKGFNLPNVYSSSELLEITSIPNRLCIIGGGVIGMEFASIFSSFGCKVQVIEFCKEILPPFDTDIAKRLRSILKKKGVEFYLQSKVEEIVQERGSLIVKYEQKEVEKSIETDVVLKAVGRVANLSSMNFDSVGIIAGKKGIVVDEHMQTNVAGIYAIGDINGLCQLAHAASAQGEKALCHIMKEEDSINLDIVPSAVFTNPEISMVGKTEQQCQLLGVEYFVHKSFYRANGKAQSMNAVEGLVKILTDKAGYILGAHILGAHAADLIHELTIAMTLHLSIHEMSKVIHVHPTLNEVVLSALRS